MTVFYKPIFGILAVSAIQGLSIGVSTGPGAWFRKSPRGDAREEIPDQGLEV